MSADRKRKRTETAEEKARIERRVKQMQRRQKEASGDARYLSEEQTVSLYHSLAFPPGTLPPPHPAFLSLLHGEIGRYCQSIVVTDDEHTKKQEIITRIEKQIQSLWGATATVQPFGSFVTGLSLPHSDLDLVVTLPNTKPSEAVGELRNIQTALHYLPYTLIPSFTLVAHARVPILRYTDNDRAIKVDICLNQQDGLKSIALMQSYLAQYPMMKPLLLTLKLFLSRLELHEVYTGGVSSFIMQLMIIAFLQMYGYNANAEGGGQHGVSDSENLGMLFFSFLDYYAHRMDYIHYGIKIAPPHNPAQPSSPSQPHPDIFYNKLAMNRIDLDKPWLLSIENPLNPDHDCGSGSFGVLRIVRSFALAHERLCLMSGEWAMNGGMDANGDVNLSADVPLPQQVVDETKADNKASGNDIDDNNDSDCDSDSANGTETLPSLTPIEHKQLADEQRVMLGPILRTLITRALYVTPGLLAALEAKQAAWNNKKKMAREQRKVIRAKKRASKDAIVVKSPVSSDSSNESESKKPKKSKIEKLKRRLDRKEQSCAKQELSDEQAKIAKDERKKEKKRRRQERHHLKREARKLVKSNGSPENGDGAVEAATARATPDLRTDLRGSDRKAVPCEWHYPCERR